jgi:hypothetical protein
LLLEVLKTLPEAKIEELKEKLGNIPWEENLEGSSYERDCCKCLDFLGDFTLMLKREDVLSSEAFLEKFSHDKDHFHFLRETLLNYSVRADIPDGQTVAADDFGE